MRTTLDLYRRIPPQYRIYALACLAGVILLLIFSGMTLFWAVKATFSIALKLIIGLAICALFFKIQQEFKKRKTGG